MSYILAFMVGFFTIILIRFLCRAKSKFDNTPEHLSVGKPVKEFVKTFKENPNRFEFSCFIPTKVGMEKVSGIASDFNTNFCHDTKTGEVFEFAFSYSDYIGGELYFYVSKPRYLTSDEELYIQRELFEYYIKRGERLNELKKLRERKRHIRMYCK